MLFHIMAMASQSFLAHLCEHSTHLRYDNPLREMHHRLILKTQRREKFVQNTVKFLLCHLESIQKEQGWLANAFSIHKHQLYKVLAVPR